LDAGMLPSTARQSDGKRRTERDSRDEVVAGYWPATRPVAILEAGGDPAGYWPATRETYCATARASSPSSRPAGIRP
jgi:hypothetical protein